MVEHDNGFAKITNYMVAKKFISRTLNKLKKSQKELKKNYLIKHIEENLVVEFVRLMKKKN